VSGNDLGRTLAQQDAIEQRYALELLLWAYQHSAHQGFKMHDVGPHFGGSCERCAAEFLGPAHSWLENTITVRGIEKVTR